MAKVLHSVPSHSTCGSFKMQNIDFVSGSQYFNINVKVKTGRTVINYGYIFDMNKYY